MVARQSFSEDPSDSGNISEVVKKLQEAEIAEEVEPPDVEEVQDEGDTKESSLLKKKKKKSKKKPKRKVGDSHAPLPSQPLVTAHFSWKCTVKPTRGRCAVATKDLKAGDIVVVEKALLVLPREQYARAICHCCYDYFKDDETVVECATCDSVFFCLRCKEEGMPEHRRVCALLREVARVAEANDCSVGLLHLIAHFALLRRRSRGTPKPPPPPAAAAEAAAPADTDDTGGSGEAGGDDVVQGLGKVQGGIVHACVEDALALEAHFEDAPPDWRESVTAGCEGLRQLALRLDAQRHNRTDAEGEPKGAGATAGAGAGAEAGAGDQAGTDAGGGSEGVVTDLLPLFDSVEELTRVAAVVNTNAHGMGAQTQGPFNTDVALGLFPFVSILNHSCSPNCCFVSERDVMYVRATQNVPAGTELCLPYINLYEPRYVRQQQLQATKYFDCACERCSEPLAASLDRFVEGVLCNGKGCKGLLLPSCALDPARASASTSWECDTCQRKIDRTPTTPSASTSSSSPSAAPPPSFQGKGSQGGGGAGVEKRAGAPANAPGPAAGAAGRPLQPWRLMDQARLALDSAMAAYRERRIVEARALLEHFIASFSDKLHPYHVLLFDARTPLLNLCRSLGDAPEAIRQCLLILEALERVCPHQPRELLRFLTLLAELYAERAAAAAGSPALHKRFKKLAGETQAKAAAMSQTFFRLSS